MCDFYLKGPETTGFSIIRRTGDVARCAGNPCVAPKLGDSAMEKNDRRRDLQRTHCLTSKENGESLAWHLSENTVNVV